MRNKKLFLLCAFILGFIAGEAQALSKGKQRRLLNKARYHFNTASYYKATVNYLKLLASDSLNKLYQYEAGLAWYYTNFDKENSLKYCAVLHTKPNGRIILLVRVFSL